ncbi:VOC family protein [Sphingomonas fuzhouensis]|uniref:VOC family protein n=1 Tax=Sphingomonas fuzhouensis TaxID=3106033 RepID=UPI002AFF5947|nr:VOC family protein [Sphingomonas sp. SGZ-02]
MTVIKAQDIAYVRIAAPDVEVQAGFLRDFGLTDLGTHDGERLFRTEAGAPFCYAVTQGETGLLGFGMWLPNEAALERLAQAEGVPIQTHSGPGGGTFIRLTDPNGFEVDGFVGQPRNAVQDGEAHAAWNENGRVARIDRFRQVRKGPSRVLRLGHLAIVVNDFAESDHWYKTRFGMLTSDEFQIEPGKSIGSFLRTDRGTAPADHHTLVIFQAGGAPRLRHLAFEVGGVDDLMAGREHLVQRGYTPHWGVGRHVLGSQIFDYWYDPFGREHEHWTDGDQLTADTPAKLVTMEEVMGIQWGMQRPSAK